jgi:ParB/RepB/Spo0J family partition protein
MKTAAVPAPPEVQPLAKAVPAIAAKPDAPKPEAPRPVAEIKGDRKTVPWSALRRSKLNPRGHFDAERLQGLAESIAAEGVLQNLTVRPHPKDKDAYEIVAGDSRYQAIEKLIQAGRAKPEFSVPVLVRDIEDTHVIALAMAENMARKELTPMEEARGFHSLVERGITTALIATRIGVTQRFVQQRLTLVDKAVPEVQKALDDGTITVTHARMLILAKPTQQKQLVKRLNDEDESWLRREDNLRQQVIGHHAPRLKEAVFDLKLYTGEMLEDSESGNSYFADAAQFKKLQAAAIEAKAAELRKTHSKVTVLEHNFDEWEWEHKPKHPKAATLLFINDDHKFEIKAGMISTEEDYRSGGAEPEKLSPGPAKKSQPEDAFTHAHRVHAHLRKTFALQRALAADPLTAQRMLCHALLMEKGCDPLNIGRASSFNDRRGFKDYRGDMTAPEVNALLAKLLEGCPGVKVSDKAGFDEIAERHAADVWTWLTKASTDRIVRLLAALVADQAGTWCDGHTMPIDDDELAVGVAEQLNLVGNEHKAGLTLQPEDLEGLRKPALLGICREFGMFSEHGGGDSWGESVTPKMNAEEIRKAIAKRLKSAPKIGSVVTPAPKVTDYVLPTLRFTADNAAELKALTKDPSAKPAPKPAAKAKKKAKR